MKGTQSYGQYESALKKEDRDHMEVHSKLCIRTLGDFHVEVRIQIWSKILDKSIKINEGVKFDCAAITLYNVMTKDRFSDIGNSRVAYIA